MVDQIEPENTSDDGTMMGIIADFLEGIGENQYDGNIIILIVVVFVLATLLAYTPSLIRAAVAYFNRHKP